MLTSCEHRKLPVQHNCAVAGGKIFDKEVDQSPAFKELRKYWTRFFMNKIAPSKTAPKPN